MTGERRRIDHGDDVGGGVRFAAPDSNNIRRIELFKICTAIDVPASTVMAAAEMAIIPISGDETLMMCVALSIAGFAKAIVARERGRD